MRVELIVGQFAIDRQLPIASNLSNSKRIRTFERLNFEGLENPSNQPLWHTTIKILNWKTP